MKRIAIILCAGLGLLLADQRTQAFWGTAGYGGYQPWWNIFAKKPHMSEQEERLQRFWHDYYDSLKDYYAHLDHLDWVSYYKNHGYQINTGGPSGYMNSLTGGGGGIGGGASNNRIQFAPVFVAPSFQWGVPQNSLSGAPGGPSSPPASAFTSGGYGPGSGNGPMMAMPGNGMSPAPYPQPPSYPPMSSGYYPPMSSGYYPPMSSYPPMNSGYYPPQGYGSYPSYGNYGNYPSPYPYPYSGGYPGSYPGPYPTGN